jgi:hypothetical protein
VAIEGIGPRKEGKYSTVFVILLILKIAVSVGTGKCHSIRVSLGKRSHTVTLKWPLTIKNNI